MSRENYAEQAEKLRNELRLRTLPVAVNFLPAPAVFPEKTRRPSIFLNKRVTICQAVTMARVYGWSVGLTREDLICVPAMLAFGLTPPVDQPATLGRLFCEVGFAPTPEQAQREAAHLTRLAAGAYGGLLLQPLAKATSTPEVVLCYGNPAQLMRLVQGYVYATGERVPASCGGKVECSEYLLAPLQTGQARLAIPGMGDRIFSMTQDDEMVFALPGALLPPLLTGLAQAGKNIGARYPITFYQNFQPEFPRYYTQLARELGLF